MTEAFICSVSGLNVETLKKCCWNNLRLLFVSFVNGWFINIFWKPIVRKRNHSVVMQQTSRAKLTLSCIKWVWRPWHKCFLLLGRKKRGTPAIGLSVHLAVIFSSLFFWPSLLGHKEPQRITNWGPASFTDTELDLKKKLWQERKNQGAQTQWFIHG